MLQTATNHHRCLQAHQEAGTVLLPGDASSSTAAGASFGQEKARYQTAGMQASRQGRGC